MKSLKGRSLAGLEREFAFLLFKCDEGNVFVSLKIKGGIALAKLNWCGGFIKRVKLKMVETFLRFMSALNLATKREFFSFPWAI